MKHNYGMSRRTALKLGVSAAAGTMAGLLHAQPRNRTPAQTEGPFYPTSDQPDKDLDLTRVAGRRNTAKGQVVVVEGRVFDENGEPMPEALVEIWQANAAGRYAHERDTSPAPLDPDFQGWGQIVTDAEGRYQFRTIKPGSYVAMGDWSRPPHIHFKVARRGYHELTTQMYFAGEPLNDSDRLLQALTADEQGRVVVAFESGSDPHDGLHGRFDIVMQAVT